MYSEKRFNNILQQCETQVLNIISKIKDKELVDQLNDDLEFISRRSSFIMQYISNPPDIPTFNELKHLFIIVRDSIKDLSNHIVSFNKLVYDNILFNIKILLNVVYFLENLLDNDIKLSLIMITNNKQMDNKERVKYYAEMSSLHSQDISIDDFILLDEGLIQEFVRDVLIPIIEEELRLKGQRISENLKVAMLNFTGNEKDKTSFTKNIKL